MAARELRDKLPYTVWARQGHIQAPPGENVNYLHVAQSLAEDTHKYKVAMVAYDRYAFRRFEEETDKLGLNVEFVEHPQGGVKKGKPSASQLKAVKPGENVEGLWMPGSLKLLEDAMLEGRIRIKKNPVLISAIMSAVTEGDRWGNFWLAKIRSINKIDAVVALCMALGAANSAPIKAKKLVLGVVR